MATNKDTGELLEQLLDSLRRSGSDAGADLLGALQSMMSRSGKPGRRAGAKEAPLPADALPLRCALLVANASLQAWLQWQRILPRHLPNLLQLAEACTRARDDGERAGRDLVDGVRRFASELETASNDQYRKLDRDLVRLIDPHAPGAAGEAAAAPAGKGKGEDEDEAGSRPRRRSAPVPRRARTKP